MSIDWIPARKIRAKEIGNRGYIPTNKNPGGYVEYESCIERDFLLIAIHDPTVHGIQHQPKTILYLDECGNQSKYTPDIYLEFQDGKRMLVEIKPTSDLKDNYQKYELRWNAAKKWAESNGMVFIVATDDKIRNARWMNIWYTLGASRCTENDEWIKKLDRIISPEGVAYNYLCNKIAEGFSVSIGKAAQILCYAIYHGFVLVNDFDSQPITKDTVIHNLGKAKTTPFTSSWENFVSEAVSRTHSDSNIDSDPVDMLENVRDDNFVQKRKEMIIEWLETPLKRRTVEWKEDFYKKWGLGRSQVYRVLDQYRRNGDRGLQLQYFNSGRNPGFGERVLDFLEIGRKHYVNGATLRIAHDKLDALCRENEIETPKFSTFKGYIYQNTTPAEKALRVGSNFSKSHFTPSLGSFQGGIMPLHVIQMDNTSLDLFPVDETSRQTLPTPFLTAAIDCYTGMITGFTVSYFASSAQSVIEVLVQSILPKDSYTRCFETQHDWPISGFPVVVLVDNGMDYRSKSLMDFCIKNRIILEFAPIRKPRFKAYIEQWFRVLKDAIRQESVPGFRPSLKQRIENPEIKPENEAMLTLTEIETWLHKWIIDGHQVNSSYDDHVLAPFLKLQEVEQGKTTLIFPLSREPPRAKWEIDTLYLSQLEQMTRQLTKDGITWEYLRYNSRELSEIHQILGDGKISIRRNKRDIRAIWIQHPTANTFIKVGLGSGWATTILKIYDDKPIHETAWIKYVKSLQGEVKEKMTPLLLRTYISKQERKDLINCSKKMTRSARKESEKVKETIRKDIGTRVGVKSESVEIEEPSEIIIDYRPKKKIDLSNVQLLPTDRFHSDR